MAAAPEVNQATSESTEGIRKKPNTAYFLFLNEKRQEIIEKYSLSGFGELGKKAAELWKELPADEKKPFEEQATKEKEEYNAWKETDEGKAALQKGKEAKAAKKAKIATRKEKKAAKEEIKKIDGLRKKPNSAYFIFANAKRQEIKEKYNLSSLGEVGKKVAEVWNELSADEKKVFEEQAAKEKADYDAWKESDEGKAALQKGKDVQSAAKAKIAAMKVVSKKRTAPTDSAQGEEEGTPAKKRAKKSDDTPEGSEKKAKAAPKAPKAPKVPKEPKVKVAKEPKVAKPKAKAKVGAKGKKGMPAVPQLSADIIAKCNQMGKANDVSYRSLLEKLLMTDGLGGIDQEKALQVLQKNEGILNVSRRELAAAGA
eukprot:gnl/TRDRNA2_/TRDRNA2_178370_c0_seq1.p1 gnl/TRDRNA2_/TRDRNA2_178370_c0~~gnl/TRDRNA2_/TRDRNA2_178370_c0_seq1.p1  ORF type:complete len:397 (-),score=151.39 gnl/TRDRNA2_/TRDRNA2_178370_c0_seq1:144-1253(-)